MNRAALLGIACLAFSAVAQADPAPLTFSEAYRAILDRSLRVQTQEQEVAASRYRGLSAAGSFLPTLSFAATDTRMGDPYSGPIRGTGVTATANLFRSGGDIAGVRASRKDIESKTEALASEHQGAEDDAVQALITFIARVEQRQIDEKIVTAREESLRISRERFRKGLMPQQEVDKVAIDLDNSRASLVDAQTLESDARAKLTALLGHDHVAVAWPWQDQITKGPALEAQEFRIESRPDWRAALASADSERLKKYQALGTLLPSLDFSATFGQANYGFMGAEQGNWETLVTLTIPIFNGFKDYASYRVQGTSAIEAEYRLETLRRQAPADVESLKLSHRLARESAIARDQTTKTAEKLYRDNLERFRLGRASVNDLALDEDRLLQAQLHQIDGWSNVHLTYMRLCHGLGGSVSDAGGCVLANR